MIMVLSSDAKPLNIPILYVRDKTFFRNKNGMMVYVGGAFEVIRQYKKAYKLIHIIDESLNKRDLSNLDLYNQATYNIHVQVELTQDVGDAIIDSLLKYNIRIVSDIPRVLQRIHNINPKYAVYKSEQLDIDTEVRDILVMQPTDLAIEKYVCNNEKDKKQHRIFVYENEYNSLRDKSKSCIFGVLFP